MGAGAKSAGGDAGFLGFGLGDEGRDPLFEELEDVGVVDFSALGGGDVEGVHRDAFFGADAGVGGVETVVVDRVEEVVEEADAVEGLDAIIPRLRPSVTFYGCALVRQFSALGVPSLNSSDAIAASRDKLFASQLFIRNGLSMPLTGFAHSPLDTKELIDMVGGAPLIVKLLVGTKGQGVILAETNKAAEGVINTMKSLNANLLVQEFIREANGSDLRCFVVGGKVVAAIERTAAPGDYRANLHQGGVARKVRLDSGERKLAIAAARALGLTVCGVDIIRSSRGPLLLEVNSSPGLEGIEKATEKNVAGSIIEELERQLGWNASTKNSPSKLSA